jgi:DNA-binding beta-propeller fold protein YncE
MFLLFLLFLDYKPQTLAVPPFKHTFGFYRASKYYLQLFLGPGYEYNDPQGIAAVKLKELDNPNTSKDNDELTTFAVNSGVGQIVYNIGLMSVKTYGNKNMFSEPKGIATNEDGLIVLADYGNKRVVKLQYKEGRIYEMGEILLPGRPFDVCFDSKNNLYITDFDNSKIYVYSEKDSLILEFGKEGRAHGEIYQPMGIEVIDAQAPYNYYLDDFIIITDNHGLKISKFSTSGRFLGSVSSFELGLVDAKFLYVAIDFFGSIYVTDEINNQVHKFDHDLKYIISIGRTGTGQGEFISPRGISIWRRYGQVFLSEKEGGQYLWLAVDGFVVGCFPNKFSSERPGTTLAIYTTEESKLYITVVDQVGEKIRDLINGIRRPAGEYLVVWDGLDNNNVLVQPGDYEFHIRLRSIYGHGRRLEKIIKAGVRCVEL